MERYDGKTKKDDYKKYALIGLGIVALLGLYKLLTWGIYQWSHPEPDFTAVMVCPRYEDFTVKDSIERAMKPHVSDTNGDDRVAPEVIWVNTNTVMDESVAVYQAAEIVAPGEGILKSELFEYGQRTLYFLAHDGKGDVGEEYPLAEYCRPLPEDLADPENPYTVDLTGSVLFPHIIYDTMPFVGCIHKDTDQETYEAAVYILRKIKNSA